MKLVTPRESEQFQNDSGANRNWYTFMVKVRNWLVENSQSGITAERPTTFLYAGRFYFDTTLNKPIWVNSTASGWIDATGTAV